MDHGILGKLKRTVNYSVALLFMLSLTPSLAGESMATETETVRLAVVNTPFDSGLLDYLLEDFELSYDIKIDIYSGSDVFHRARDGKADIVISHYGKAGLADFVMEDLGSWPKMVFSNQAALIGPANDPANVRNSSSLAEALELIAASGNTLIANNNEGLLALIETTQNNQVKNNKAWFKNTGLSKGRAIKAAESEQAYVIWGAIPFLKFKQKNKSSLTLLLTEDPSLQRIMAITRVNPRHFSGINDEAAKRLEDYLLTPATQAKINTFKVDGVKEQLWWPAARHN